MFGRRLRSVLVLVAVAAALARLVQALRGEPTATFSHHPSTDPAPQSERIVAADTDPEAVEPQGPETLFDVDPDPPTAVPSSPSAPDAAASPAAWRAPVDGACPDGYPIKAKVKSGIFHLPGMSAYDRTTPDRCYPDAATAVADGLRPAKR